MRDRLRVGVRRLVGEAGPLAGDLVAPEAQRRRALAAGDEPDDLLAVRARLALQLERAPQHLAVERAREPAVAGDDDDRDALHLVAPLHQREVPERRRSARRSDHQLLHPVGVRPHLLDPRLRTAQPRAGDELERLRDLARVLDGGDPPADVLERRHARLRRQ